jgi:hypothetical protein
MTKRLLLILLLVYCAQIQAQYYHNFNSFFQKYHYQNATRYIYCDTVSQSTYFIGDHVQLMADSIDDVLIELHSDSLKPIFKLTGSYALNMHSIERYKNKLYIAGIATEYFSQKTTTMFVYDGINWDTLAESPNDFVTSMLVHKDRLYVNGYFNKIGSMPCGNIAYLDSTGWHCLDQGICPQQNFGAGEYVGTMVMYKDTLYMGGIIIDTCRPNMFLFIRYNGSYWDTVLGWQVGNNSGVSALAVYQDKLYVAGSFLSSDGASTINNIVYFDGSKWYSTGTGSDYGVGTMTVANGKLYASGGFTYIDGLYSPRIAAWDGHQWCTIDSQQINPDGAVLCASMGDSTVFIYSGVTKIGSDTIFRHAYWTGGTHTYQCGTYYTGTEDIKNNRETVTLYPNPSSDRIYLSDIPTGASLSITDMTGRKCPIRIEADQINISALPSGIYYLSIQDQDGVITKKFVKQ